MNRPARHVDVIVAGLGSMGSAAAHQLAARGLSVLGLERFWPAHDQGSAHGGTRIVRQAYFESPAYVPLLRSAYEGWHRLAEESGRDLTRERVGFVGLGSVGSATLRTLFRLRPHPAEVRLCDVHGKREGLLEFRRELVEDLGYRGPSVPRSYSSPSRC